MFKIFLRKKLHSGSNGDPKIISHDRKSRQRNRRLYQRYQVNQQHLTILNDQDILVIRDLSPQGFSSDVSTRAFDRFMIDDQYEARMRYLGEVHDIVVKVAWKKNKVVGFELCEVEDKTLQLFQRLLRPVKLASSLTKVEAEFLNDSDGAKTWYHGDEGTDLMIWRTPENRTLDAWQLVADGEYVEWSSQHGLQSGRIKGSPTDPAAILNESEGLLEADHELDHERIRMAADLIMAIRYEVKEEILQTIVPDQIRYEHEKVEGNTKVQK